MGGPRVPPSISETRDANELLAEFTTTGREQAFEEIVRRYAGMVFAVALRTTKNAHDAEDTTQAVFLTLAVQVKAGRPVTHLGPWLRQVATRTALDVRRARKRREKREHRHGTAVAQENGHRHNGNGVAKHHEVDPDELNRLLAEELARLPAKYRLPLISLYFGGMSREEIARELGCKIGTLGVRIHRGRQILARRLSERAGVPPGHVLGAYMATAIAAAVSATMASRTAETAARIALGQELGDAVAANVLALIKGAASGSALVKLKVALVTLLLGALSATAAEASGVLQAIERQLPPELRSVVRWLRAPLRMPLRPLLPEFNAPQFTAPRFSANDTPQQRAGGGYSGNPVMLVSYPSPLPVPREQPQRRSAPSVSANIASAPARAALTTSDIPTAPAPTVTAPRSTSVGDRPVAPTPTPFVAHAAPRSAAVTSATPQPAAADRTPAPSSVQSYAYHFGEGDVTKSSTSLLSSNLLSAGSSRGAAGRGLTASPAPYVAVEAPSLIVAEAAGSEGSYHLTGGPFAAVAQDIGFGGKGSFEQTGGTNSATQVRLGAGGGGAGTYTLAGRLDVAPTAGVDAPAGVQVGGAGHGSFYLGNAQQSGTIQLASGGAIGGGGGAGGGAGAGFEPDLAEPVFDVRAGTTPQDFQQLQPGEFPADGQHVNGESIFVVRADERGSGTFRGWGGVIGLGSHFVQNGQTIADGYGPDRALIFAGFERVTSTIENPADGGAAGWYARDGGRLILPKLAVEPGTHTYTWGEDAADPTIDLVNSVRVTLRDAQYASTLDVSLLATDRADVPVLPEGHTFIGVWSIDTALAMPEGGIDLTVRYDEGLAAQLGLNENVLKLWRHDATGWHRIFDASFLRDPELNLLTGHANDLDFFAVSAPEPSAATALALAGATLLVRRRRGARRAAHAAN